MHADSYKQTSRSSVLYDSPVSEESHPPYAFYNVWSCIFGNAMRSKELTSAMHSDGSMFGKCKIKYNSSFEDKDEELSHCMSVDTTAAVTDDLSYKKNPPFDIAARWIMLRETGENVELILHPFASNEFSIRENSPPMFKKKPQSVVYRPISTRSGSGSTGRTNIGFNDLPVPILSKVHPARSTTFVSSRHKVSKLSSDGTGGDSEDDFSFRYRTAHLNTEALLNFPCSYQSEKDPCNSRETSRTGKLFASTHQPHRITMEKLKENDDSSTDNSMTEEAKLWKCAVCPKSGRTYYYHTVTRQTQWQKPLCCATDAEREEIQRKERQTREFFASMESNILKMMSEGAYSSAPKTSDYPGENAGTSCSTKSVNVDRENENDEIFRGDQSKQPSMKMIPRTSLVRTISTMQGEVLAALIQRVPSNRGIDHNSTHLEKQPSLQVSSVSSLSQNPSTRSLPEEKSMNFSSILRYNSAGRNGNFRTSLMNVVVEDENEDASSNSTDQSPFVKENYSFLRGYGSRNLNFTVNSDDPIRGLVRETGSLSVMQQASISSINEDAAFSREESLNFQSLKNGDFQEGGITPSRENSLNFAALLGSSTRSRNSDDLHAARRGTEAWGSTSFLAEIADCAAEEEQAMFQLTVITQEMSNIETSDTSSASSIESDDEPLNGLDMLSPDTEVITGKRYHQPRRSSMEVSDDEEEEDDDEIPIEPPKPDRQPLTNRPTIQRPNSLREAAVTPVEKPMGLQRRNTCGTIYVGSTMSAPDTDATIKCVCGVVRAHIVQAESDRDYEQDATNSRYNVFNDLKSQRQTKKSSQDRCAINAQPSIPSLEEICSFYRDVFLRAKMETDCIIISLIYVERLIKSTDGAIRPRASNWRSVLFSCMVLASKVWDDLSMWNADFSQTCPAGVKFPLKRVNELEVAVLSALKFKVKVPASEYAKYYFLLRAMLLKSGLGSKDLKTMNPLDVEGAKQLQHISSQYQSAAKSMSDLKKAALCRSKTTGGTMDKHSSYDAKDGSPKSPIYPMKVGLEHLVQM